MIEEISIDIETYSEIDLVKSGVYPYSEHESFEIMLFAYSVNHGPVEVVDLVMGEMIPDEIIAALDDPSVRKFAFNAMFERICLSRHVGHWLSPEGWYCTMIWVSTLGLPHTLEQAGAALNVKDQKMKEGKDLIRFFCKPVKPTKSNNYQTRNLPKDYLEKWDLMKKYNKRDVETEMALQDAVSEFPVPDSIWQEYHDDQIVNDGGVLVDQVLARQAVECSELFKVKNMERARFITGLDNPGSTQQLSGWLRDQGMEFDDLSKKSVSDMLKDADGEVEEVLRLRQLLSKSSVKKYEAMECSVCSDGRIRGLFQFFGAHTGRFISRIVQLQNLPRNSLSDLEVARDLIKNGCFEAADLLYDSVPDVLAQLIRTALIPEDGKKFVVADYSAVEARIIAWLAGEEWRMQAFKDGADIYCASAEAMFHVPVSKHGPNAELRQRGKVAELGLGYGGGPGALISMGALDQGLKEEDLQPLVDAWRKSNPAIVKLWWDTDKAIKLAIRTRRLVRYKNLTFQVQSDWLFIGLPSGRRIAYYKPRFTTNRFGGESVAYYGITVNKKFDLIESYGPRFVENIVQGIARDLLVDAIHRFLQLGYDIRMHVHDEVVIEAKLDADVDELCKIMSKTPDWADGLLLDAAGFESSFYMKD